MLRKKYSEPAQPDGQQALLEFETPADQPGRKDPKQFFKKNWKKITEVVCAAAVAAAVLLPRKSAKPAQADVYYYNASAKTVWIYSRKAAGRITAVSPSASAYLGDSGRHQLHNCQLLGGIAAFQPERRRGAGGHPAAGHEQRSRGGADR